MPVGRPAGPVAARTAPVRWRGRLKGRKRRKMPAIREDVYEVEELLKNRVVRGKEQYLVKWKGFSLGHSSWEPVSNLRCPRLLQQYREEQD